MHAVILATGPGVRIRPFPTAIPAPLLPVSDTACLIDVQLRQLAQCGFRSVTVLADRHLPMLELHLDAVAPAGPTTQVVRADSRLGPFGALVALSAASPAVVPPSFVVVTASVLTDLPFDRLLTAHRASGGLLTIGTVEHDERMTRARVRAERGRAVGYRPVEVDRHEIDAGVYAVSRELLRRYQGEVVAGFEDLARDLLAVDTPLQVFRHDGRWVDLGDPVGYHQALRTGVDLPGQGEDRADVDLRERPDEARGTGVRPTAATS